STKPPEGTAARERWAALNALLSLCDEMPPGSTIQDFSAELAARQSAHHEPTVDSVTLCAIHAAKGLEWSVVHVVGLSEGVLPIVYAADAEALEEERRLCYVATTRAKDVLRLSGTASGGRSTRSPSRFVEEAGIRIPS